MKVNYVPRPVLVTLSLSGTWSGKSLSTLLGKMVEKKVEKVVV